VSQLRRLALSDQERRRVQAVGESASRGADALGELLPQLDDPSWAVRRAVVAALGAMGDPAVRPLCELLLARRDHEARLAAVVDSLVVSRGDVDAAALELAESTISAVVCDAAQILGRRKSARALPKLAQLAGDQDENVALAAIEALGRIGGDGALTPLIAAVEGRSFFRAFPAIDVLGRIGSTRALKALLEVLAEPHFAVEAVRALGRIGDSAAVPALARLLGKPNDAIVRVASLAIVEILDRRTERFGAPPSVGASLSAEEARKASQRVIQSLEHADPNEQAALVRILSWVGGESAALALIDLLSEDDATSQAAVSALGRLGKSVEPHLLEALAHADSERRVLLLPLLSHGADVAKPVAECLSDPNPSVRALACDALARIGDPTFVPRLFELLGDSDARVTQGAVAAIQSLGSAETERLALVAARSGDARVRRAGLRIVSYFGYEASLDVLIESMSDADERIRDAAISGLPFLDDPIAREALVTATVHPSARTRAAAMRALGQATAHPRSIQALRIGLRDPDPWVRYFACQALSRLKDEDSADMIASLISDPAGQVRVAVIEALAHLRGARALESLHRAATGNDSDVRRAALLGLGHVKDPSSLPVLRQGLAADDPATRLVAVSALAQYELPGIAQDLGAALSDGEDRVRGAAIALLATRPGAEAARVLIGHLTAQPIRERIVAALTQPAPGRIEALVEALNGATSETAPLIVSALIRTHIHREEATRALEDAFASPDAAVRRAVAPALAVLGTIASRSLLAAAAAQDHDEEVREIAAAATR
jgi:HEAT repeat protein